MPYRIFLAVWAAVAVILQFAQPIPNATTGLPGSAAFAYGASVNLEGELQIISTNAACGIGLDWLAVDLDWARVWSQPEAEPELAAIQALIEHAGKLKLAVMVALTNPPDWAWTASGPSSAAAAELIRRVIELDPKTVLAIELLPGANTSAGWGLAPDPAQYAEFYRQVYFGLRQNEIATTVVAGGLKPLTTASPGTDVDDLEFLEGLYAAGIKEIMPVVSLRLPNLSGTPMEAPVDMHGKPVSGALRHYEQVRQIMLSNEHANGRLWITQFAPPAILDGDLEAQATWMTEAYRLLRSQLYLGGGFFDSLNPEVGNEFGLVLPGLRLHPLAEPLAKLISETNNTFSILLFNPLRQLQR